MENRQKNVDLAKVAEGVRLILEGLGENPEREGLQRTPERVAQMYAELTAGRWLDAAAELTPLPGEDFEQIVLVKDISLASLCEHHLAPFTGRCHIAYIPQAGRVVGLSKLAQLTDIFARRLQVQERLTTDIAGALQENLQPLGVLVIIEAEHTCMTMRGVKKPGAVTVTSVALGAFKTDAAALAQVMAMLKLA